MAIKQGNIVALPKEFMVALDCELKKISNIQALGAGQYAVLLNELRHAAGFQLAGTVWEYSKAARRPNAEQHILMLDIERAFIAAGLEVAHSNKLIAGARLPKSESDLFKVHRCINEMLGNCTVQDLKPVYKHSNKIEVNQ